MSSRSQFQGERHPAFFPDATLQTMVARPPLALAYHGVATHPLRKDPHGLFTRPAALVRHVSLLRRWGYRLVRFGELAEAVQAGEGGGLAALTFDDGLADNLHHLVPVLRHVDAPATVFVVSSWDGTPHPDAPWARTLTGSELRQLSSAGVEIGSHGHCHVDLTTLPFDEVRDGFTRSREQLESLLDRPVSVAAYPFGRATEDTARACREAGFAAACRAKGEGSWSDPWNLPRQDMNAGTGFLGFVLKRDDRYEPLMRTPAARVVRAAARRAKALVR